MSLETCNNYFNKLQQIITACNDATTTKINLETLLEELEICDNQIDTDIETIPLPLIFEHLNKYILVQQMRVSKIILQQALHKIIDVRNADLLNQATNNTTTLEEQNTYALETIAIKNLVETTVNVCSCMSSFKYVTSKCAH